MTNQALNTIAAALEKSGIRAEAVSPEPDAVMAMNDAIHILNEARRRCFSDSRNEIDCEAGRFLLHAICWLRPSANYEVRPQRSNLWQRLADRERRAA